MSGCFLQPLKRLRAVTVEGGNDFLQMVIILSELGGYLRRIKFPGVQSPAQQEIRRACPAATTPTSLHQISESL